jgi:N-formylglutamate amidohydrolase
MPSTVRGGQGRLRPDIVVGDRYGASCSSEISDAAGHILSRLGYSISRNKPYAGGFITEHYGKPGLGFHTLQIEVNRCLYMDERTLQPTAGFSRLKADLGVFVAELAALFRDGLLAPADAAE